MLPQHRGVHRSEEEPPFQTLACGREVIRDQVGTQKRWRDPSFLAALPIPRDRLPTSDQLRALDLRGVPQLANGEPLWHFAIHSAKAEKIDVSFGDGVLSVHASEVRQLTACEFRFDRASRFSKSVFTDCDFTDARFKLDITDAVFMNCCFARSIFAGGIREYGLRRCRFENCVFRGAVWKNTYVLASSFIACDFSEMKFHNALIAGFKHRDCAGIADIEFVDCEVRSILTIPTEVGTD